MKYKVMLDGFVENGVRHMAGDELKVSIDDGRAKALINAGYIIEEDNKPVEAKVETKVAEAETKKVITGEETKKKDATGVGAGLLGRKKSKK